MNRKITALLIPPAALAVCYCISRLFVNFIFGIHYMCPIKLFTGFLCPGCGATRALSALLRLDVITSLRDNPIIILMCIFLVMLYLQFLTGTLGSPKKIIPDSKVFCFVLSGIIICYYIARNFITVLQPL